MTWCGIVLAAVVLGFCVGRWSKQEPGRGKAYATVERGPYCGTVVSLETANMVSVDFMLDGLRVSVPIEDVRLSTHPTVSGDA